MPFWYSLQLLVYFSFQDSNLCNMMAQPYLMGMIEVIKSAQPFDKNPAKQAT